MSNTLHIFMSRKQLTQLGTKPRPCHEKQKNMHVYHGFFTDLFTGLFIPLMEFDHVLVMNQLSWAKSS